MADSDSDNYDDPSKSPPRKKQLNTQPIYDKKYLKQWESLLQFKGWLTSSIKGPKYFQCKACGEDYKGGKSKAEKHSLYEKHKKNISTMRPLLQILQVTLRNL